MLSAHLGQQTLGDLANPNANHLAGLNKKTKKKERKIEGEKEVGKKRKKGEEGAYGGGAKEVCGVDGGLLVVGRAISEEVDVAQ